MFGGLYTTVTALSVLKHHNNIIIVTIVYKPQNTTLFGKAVEMKFKVASGKTEWFKGQITKYDGLTTG